ncbi:MAG: hypothetical protein ABSC17_11105 [Thermacetogeniaceae bacterium]
MTSNLGWLLLFIVAWAIVLLVVPRDRLFSLLLPSFLGGTVSALIINLIGVPVLGLWRFPATLVSMVGIPVFLLLSYWAEMILFFHYWDHLPGGSAEKGFYLMGFSLATTVLAYFALIMRYVIFFNWNLLYFLLTSFVAHSLAILFYTAPGIRESFRRT